MLIKYLVNCQKNVKCSNSLLLQKKIRVISRKCHYNEVTKKLDFTEFLKNRLFCG